MMDARADTAPVPEGPRGLMALPDALHLIYRKDIFRFYRYPASRSRACTAALPEGYTLARYDALEAVPPEVARVVMPGRPFDLMRSRMRRRLARLLVVQDRNGQVAAYGWMQSWRPFRRSFHRVASSGRMLGYYWTHPDHRRKGLYNFLLLSCVAAAEPSESLFAYAEIENTASLRCIQAAGFEYFMDLRIRRILHFFSISAAIERSDHA